MTIARALLFRRLVGSICSRPCRSSHPLARAPAVQPSDLNNLPFITPTDGRAPVLHRVIRDFISEQGIRPSQTYEAENLGIAFSLIASIGGISLLPEYAFRLCPPTVVAVRLEPEAPMIDRALAYHPDNRSELLRTFVRHFERLTAASQRHKVRDHPSGAGGISPMLLMEARPSEEKQRQCNRS